MILNGTRLCIAVLIGSLAGMAQNAPKSRLIAEGEYSLIQNGQKNGATKILDHWLMYLLPDGTFKVDIELKTDPPDKGQEHLTFTKDMRLAGYEWLMQREGKAEPASIHCDFADSEARCAGKTMNGRPFSTSLAVKAPYFFLWASDNAFFDVAWSFQAMVWQTKRSRDLSTSISVITLGPGDTEYGTVLTSLPEPYRFSRYLGRDIIEVVSQKVNAHKFEAKGGASGDEDLWSWFSDSGLLLKMTVPATADPLTLVLSSYQGPHL